MGLPCCFIRPLAHRGLHDHRSGRVENSAAAFKAAIAGGFGIGCDVRPAAGGLPVVFHDERAERLLGIDAATDALSEDQLRKLAYADGSKVMTFAAFLALVGGHVPVLAEVKSSWSSPPPAFVEEVSRLATTYKGPLALMSFDHDWMAAFHARAPRVRRGLVVSSSDHPAGVLGKTGPMGELRCGGSLAALDKIDASFAAFDVSFLPTAATKTLRQARRMPVFAWTVRTSSELRTANSWADAAIFEGNIVAPIRRC